MRLLPRRLRFVLEPYDGVAADGPDGWRIAIFGADSTQDYVGIATPPYHGVNEAVIEAWHFRNQANTGPNTGDINAPQEQRGFFFVTNPADYATYLDALDRVLWPNRISDAAVDSAQAVLERVPRGEGQLTIRGMKLGGLGSGIVPWFESMRFQVELSLAPAPGAEAPSSR